MTTVLLVAPMPISDQRAGPAIRFWEFARILSASHSTTLLVPNEDHPTDPHFTVRTGSVGASESKHTALPPEEDLANLLAAHQVVLVQGPALQAHPGLAPILAAGQHRLVVDLYDPITLEQLAIDPGGEAGRRLQQEYTALLREQVLLGDFFLCASERQRQYWLGWLAALGRINHDTCDGRDLRHLIDVVPFGLPADPPRPAGPVLKGVWPGIAAQDRVIVWGGGLWEWLDPLTAIQAMRQVASCHPTARLVFFEADRYQSTMHARAKELAAELKLLGQHVFFVGWLPPDRWGACLLEADVGLSYHPATAETHLAFRTRLLDYIWAGLPVVTAGGDVLSELIASQDLGIVVEPGIVGSLARALIELLAEPDPRTQRAEAFRRAAGQFSWERVTQPLVRYCSQPWPAGDRASGRDERWQAVQTEQILARAAHAERRLAETQAQSREQAMYLEAQVDELNARLEACETRFSAAMDGRVMRWMTRIQRGLRGGE